MPISKIKTSGIEDSSVTADQLAENSVTSAKIGVDVIVAEDIANNAITVAELADNAVTNAKLADDAVDTTELADGAVTSAKISGLTGASTGILQADGDGTISTTVISSDSITEGNSSVEVVDTGTGHVAVTVDGSETARFASGGNVGLGGAPTTSYLEGITGGETVTIGSASEASSTLVLKDDDGVFELATTGGTFRIYDDDIERVRVTDSGHVTMPYQPSFLAFASPSRAASDYLYNFGNIDHNVGNHYNNATGTFTAPVAGRYLMTAGAWAQSGSDGYLTFMVNDNEFVGGHIHANGNASSAYSNVVLDLNAGDYVNLKSFFSIQGSTPRNYWSGMLIG